MLKEALQYLVGLKDNKTYEIDDVTYSDHELNQVMPKRFYPKTITVSSLDSIVKLVKDEYCCNTSNPVPLFIRVSDPAKVEVFTMADDRQVRSWPYEAVNTDVTFREGWREQQEAIIELRSRFIPNGDSEYLLNLISRINNEEGVKSEDNGITQTVTAKKGASLMTTEQVKPRLELQPFRTFREVPQPASEFILRLDERGRVGLFEADGGVWKIEAKELIRHYLEEELSDLCASGTVVIMI